MAENEITVWGQVDDRLPSAVPDNARGPIRLDRHREQIVRPAHAGQSGPAMDGTYFVATNPTPGTGIAHVQNATVSETAGYPLVIRNLDGVGGKRIIMDRVKLIAVTQVWTSATRADYFWKLGPLPTHYTGTGTLLTPQNVNGEGSAASVAAVYLGACVTVADTAARIVDRGILRGVIPVLLDTWIFRFAGVEDAAPSSLGGAVPLQIPIPVPPVIIPPGWHLSLQIWAASIGAVTPTFEVCANWWER